MFNFRPRAVSRQKIVSQQKKVEVQKTQDGNLNSPINYKVALNNGKLGSVGAVNTVSQKYIVDISQPVPNPQGENWIGLVLNLISLPNEKKRYLNVEKLLTLLIGYADSGFAQGYGLYCQQIDGMYDKVGLPTHIIATVNPTQISIIQSSIGDISAYSVIYGMKQGSHVWQITGRPTLRFGLVDLATGAKLPLPILQPVTLELQILRVIV